MSRSNYFYDPPESFNKVLSPGEICDHCCSLNKTTPAGQMVPMPCDRRHMEFGGEEGDIHMHLKCAEETRDEYKRLYEEADAAIKKFLTEKQGQ